MGTGIAAFSGILTIGIICCTGLFAIVVAGAAIGIPIYMSRKNQKKMQDLMATGQQGEATVLALQDTGMRINDNPRVAITLEVRIPGYSPYQISKTATIPMIRMSQVQVGAVIPVVADPTQPTNPDKVGLLLR